MAAMPGAIGIGKGQITLDGLPLPHSADSQSEPPGLLRVTAEHMEQALLGVKRRTATALGAPSVPKVKKPFPHEVLLRTLASLTWSMLREVAPGPDLNRLESTFQAGLKGSPDIVWACLAGRPYNC